MKIKAPSGVLMIGVCLVLSACGGSDYASKDVKGEKPTVTRKANNPLSNQQEILNASRGLQARVDADTARKKKAMEEAMN
ncbi:MAG: hypothetical protein ABGY96_10785 [bacterium]|nr:hypothetical protein [Gammaproteobacteria bacterium]HIL98347.1 hypothetical protein [Pseudomonadales bacterium]